MNTERLARICAELQITPEIARQFVSDYLDLLDQRLTRIDQALDAGLAGSSASREEAVVALLSLDASSSMLGAFEVALAARRVRIEVQTGRVEIDADRRELHRAAEDARAALGAVLVASD